MPGCWASRERRIRRKREHLPFILWQCLWMCIPSNPCPVETMSGLGFGCVSMEVDPRGPLHGTIIGENHEIAAMPHQVGKVIHGHLRAEGNIDPLPNRAAPQSETVPQNPARKWKGLTSCSVFRSFPGPTHVSFPVFQFHSRHKARHQEGAPAHAQVHLGGAAPDRLKARNSALRSFLFLGRVFFFVVFLGGGRGVNVLLFVLVFFCSAPEAESKRSKR